MIKHRLFLSVLCLFIFSVILKVTMNNGVFSLSLITNLISGESSSRFVFFHLRLPALLGAIVSSFLMVIATFILQGISKNELADPSALGFQNIAVTVLAVFYLYVPVFRNLSYTQILFIAALSVLLFSFFMFRFSMSGKEENQGDLLILTGIGVNSFFQMLLTYIKTYKNDAQDILSFLLQGNFDSLDLDLAIGLSMVGVVIILIFFSQYSKLRLIQLDPKISQGLGFSLLSAQAVLFSILSFSVATSLMLGSSFPFVAFTAIHATRRYFSLHFVWHLVSSSMFMASAILISDVLAHQLFPMIIPTNLFLGVFSGFGFLIIYLRRRTNSW